MGLTCLFTLSLATGLDVKIKCYFAFRSDCQSPLAPASAPMLALVSDTPSFTPVQNPGPYETSGGHIWRPPPTDTQGAPVTL